MRTCLRRCSRTRLTVRTKLWRNSTLKKTLRRLLRKNSTRNTILPGTAWLGETSGLTLRTRRSTSSISTWAKWRFCYSSQDDWDMIKINIYISLCSSQSSPLEWAGRAMYLAALIEFCTLKFNCIMDQSSNE